MTHFSVFPHKGYLNSDITIQNHTSDKIRIDNTTNESVYILNGYEHEKITLPAGKYHLSCVYEGILCEETIVIQDAIRLGGSNVKNTFTFEDSPWLFVVMRDRTYLHNMKTGLETLENEWSPEKIEHVFGDVFLLSSGENNYTLFSVQTMSTIVHFKELIYKCKSKIVYSFDKNSFVIRDLETNRISTYLFDQFKLNPINKCLSIYTKEQDLVKVISLETLEIVGKKNLLSQYLKPINFFCFTDEGYAFVKENSRVEWNEYKIIDVKSDKVYYMDKLRFPIIEVDNFKIDNVDLTSIKGVFNDTSSKISKMHKYLTFEFAYNSLTTKTIKDKLYFSIVQKGIHLCNYGYNRSSDASIFYLAQESAIASRVGRSNELFQFGNMLACYLQFDKLEIYDDNLNVIKIFDNVKFLNAANNEWGYFSTLDKNKETYSFYSVKSREPTLLVNGFLSFVYFNDHGVIIKENEKGGKELYYISKGNLKLVSKFNGKHCIQNEMLFVWLTSDWNAYPNVFVDGELLPLPVKQVNCISKKGSSFISVDNNRFIIGQWNRKLKKYNTKLILKEIFNSSSFNDAYFSENKNQLVYKEDDQTYGYYDFNSKEFKSFATERLIIKGCNGQKSLIDFDANRRPILKDPVTLQVIPSQYINDYSIVSPDGRYQTTLQCEIKYYNKITRGYISKVEYDELNKELELELGSDRLTARKKYVEKHKEFFKGVFEKFEENTIDDILNSRPFLDYFIEEKSYINYYDTVNNNKKEFCIGTPLWFLNYISFSYDSKYIALAGKYGGQYGLFLLYELESERVVIKDDKSINKDSRAVWITAFNRFGDVAYYTSIPNCYYLRREDFPTNTNIHSVQPTIISGKNFLAFSASGEYFALSDQGYTCYSPDNPDWGHQPSSRLFINKRSDLSKSILTFHDHGSSIKGVATRVNSVASVAFSVDEKQILSVSNDGVIIVRNLNLK